MKRAQRKKNLKNLQSAGAENIERRKLRSAKSGISNYLVKEKDTAEQIEVERSPDAEDDSAHAHTIKRRINLTRFIFPNKKDVPSNLLKIEHDSDDFETPVKKIKRAPKLSQPDGVASQTVVGATNNLRRKKRQQKITTAFLRNEEMFSEVAAQHSLADNLNPDEVQLALALSRSEVETKMSREIVVNAENSKESIDNVQENIRNKLKKFGFRTGNKEDYTHCFAATFLNGKRRAKTKWGNKFTALTLRDSKAQYKKLNAYVEAILNQQIRMNLVPFQSEEQNFVPYKLQSSIVSQCAVVDTAAQIFRNIETLTTKQDLERFFITELFPVTKLPAGHLLKNWAAIPGRDLSPERKHKRSGVEAQRYKKFYEELEACFSNNLKKLRNENEEIENEETSLTKEEGSQSQEKQSTNSELSALIELIGNTQEEWNKENAVHLYMEKNSSSTQTSVESVVTVKQRSSLSNEICPSTQTRSASPDLFADSDSDGAEAVEENKLNNITTYEVYSSDDVKTSSETGCKIDLLSVKADVIVDLTQDKVDSLNEDDDSEMKSATPKKLEISKRLDFLCVSNEEKNSHLNEFANPFEDNEDVLMEDAECNELGVKPLKETVSNILDQNFLGDKIIKFGKSCSFESTMHERNISREILLRNQSVASIDLTQSDQESIDGCDNSNTGDDNDNDNDKNEDNVCILLSDDEVNYSIMKANAACSVSPEISVESSSDSSDEENANQFEPKQQHNFSVLDLIDVEHSFHMNDSFGEILSKNTSFDLSGDIEPINKEYLVTESQAIDYPSTPKKVLSVLKQQRAEFGILESQSEPFSQTPPPHWFKTPTKVTPHKKESPSSSSDRDHRHQRYSRQSCSRKFESFLFEAPKSPIRDIVKIVSPTDDDDFDEFDRLVYGSPPKRIIQETLQPDMPAGLNQLLTAEISLEAQCFRTASQPESQSSIVLRTLTPEKAAKITTEEEITINNHVYTVRVTNALKPNFATQSDAELLKQLYNFGIKPLKRHQAVKLLEHIYNETHPIIDSAICNENHNKLESISSKTSECSKDIQSDEENNVAKKDSGDKMILTSKIKKFMLEDCNGDLLLRYAFDLSAELRNDEELYIFQTNVTKKTQHPLLPLHIAWFNLVCSNATLHESILMYEPIDLQEIYLFLKSLGYRYDPKDLKNFFDRRCIIFRYDLTPPEKQANRHIRNPNKKVKTTTTISRTQKAANTKSSHSQHTLHKYISL